MLKEGTIRLPAELNAQLTLPSLLLHHTESLSSGHDHLLTCVTYEDCKFWVSVSRGLRYKRDCIQVMDHRVLELRIEKFL